MSYQSLDPSAAQAKLAAGSDCLLIDVRTPEEFSEGHVPGAYNVPFLFFGPGGMRPNPQFAQALEAHFKKDASLVFQ